MWFSLDHFIHSEALVVLSNLILPLHWLTEGQRMSQTACLWKSVTTCRSSLLLPCDSGNQTQVIRFCGKHLYFLSHLTGPRITLLEFQVSISTTHGTVPCDLPHLRELYIAKLPAVNWKKLSFDFPRLRGVCSNIHLICVLHRVNKIIYKEPGT